MYGAQIPVHLGWWHFCTPKAYYHLYFQIKSYHPLILSSKTIFAQMSFCEHTLRCVNAWKSKSFFVFKVKWRFNWVFRCLKYENAIHAANISVSSLLLISKTKELSEFFFSWQTRRTKNMDERLNRKKWDRLESFLYCHAKMIVSLLN